MSVEVAIVGAGNAASTIHAPAWKDIRKARLIAVCDANKERAEKFAEIWKVPKIYTDFDDLLEEEKAALIDICTPADSHAQLCVKAMNNGHHVVLEKPMALNLDDCEQILNEWKKGKAKLCVIHNFLFEPPMLKIRSLIKKKKLDILSVDIRMLHTVEDEMISNRNHWVHNLPGGRFGESLIHPIYVLRNIVGKLNVRDVYAAKRGLYDWVKYDELYVTLDSNGKFCTVHVSFNSPRWSSIFNIKVYSKELILTYDGTNQTLLIQGALLPGYLSRGKGKYRSELKILKDALNTSWQILSSATKSISNRAARAFLNKRESGHRYLFKSFIDSISEEKETPYSPEEAYDATKTFLEILEILSRM
ncbi:MAG: Gfo/Idh/MocA family oxidoreductase [Candidatus Bathyarchaeota archaeon]|nr:Gfo/Idh/MocA family oxidoreductase [Candidatus Bathyarchaeota archaeon]